MVSARTTQRNTIISIANETISPGHLKHYLSRTLHLDGNDFALAFEEVLELVRATRGQTWTTKN